MDVGHSWAALQDFNLNILNGTNQLSICRKVTVNGRKISGSVPKEYLNAGRKFERNQMLDYLFCRATFKSVATIRQQRVTEDGPDQNFVTTRQ